MRTLRAGPGAASFIESMRDIGYSLETALADIIDNSITAQATRIEIRADSASTSPSITIVDNGCGMTEDELLVAMRLGSKSPLEGRPASDLGRFGLGLKTASFSQCRRLTVVSRRNGSTSAMRWDLGRVAETDDWVVDVLDDCSGIPGVELLGDRGTAVAWEHLDRVIDAGSAATQYFNQKLADASKHLELVFHRYLEGEVGLKRIAITLNSRSLAPFDPFFKQHPATSRAPLETIQFKEQAITVQAYTLPHHNRVTPEEWERYAGNGGYLKNQGFYLYRAKRLIVHGTWFGLARDKEMTKLARVQIDTPNELDADWKVDVKKASAQPPAAVRERLRKLVDTIAAPSRRVYSNRGRRLLDENQLPVWVREQARGSISYRLNPEHPVFARLSEELPEAMRGALLSALEVAAASLPLDALFSDLGGEDGVVSVEWISDEALRAALTTSVEALRRHSVAPDLRIEMLQLAEPFKSNWTRASDMLRELDGEDSE